MTIPYKILLKLFVIVHQSVAYAFILSSEDVLCGMVLGIFLVLLVLFLNVSYFNLYLVISLRKDKEKFPRKISLHGKPAL
jgi:hypothetical protein